MICYYIGEIDKNVFIVNMEILRHITDKFEVPEVLRPVYRFSSYQNYHHPPPQLLLLLKVISDIPDREDVRAGWVHIRGVLAALPCLLHLLLLLPGHNEGRHTTDIKLFIENYLLDDLLMKTRQFFSDSINIRPGTPRICFLVSTGSPCLTVVSIPLSTTG